MSLIEDSLVAYEKYGESSCFPYFIETACELTFGTSERSFSLLEKAWRLAIQTEQKVSCAPPEMQARFVKAVRLVLDQQEKEVKKNPDLLGLTGSLPSMRAFVNHVEATVSPSLVQIQTTAEIGDTILLKDAPIEKAEA